MTTAVSIGLVSTTPPEVVRAFAPRVERLGFTTLWINDIPGGDSLAGLRAAGEATSTLGLASGVIPLDRRPVDSLDLAGLPAGRPRSESARAAGRIRPVAFVRAGLAALRDVTDAPIVVGALGPRMRRLAAEEADGVLLNWLTPEARQRHRRTNCDATRGIGACERRCTCARSSTRRRAPALDRESARYESVPAYAANFERLGIRRRRGDHRRCRATRRDYDDASTRSCCAR